MGRVEGSRRERDMTLDLIKAFAILMVVFLHNGQLNPDSVLDNISMLLPSAAVPLFFMASGAVFFQSRLDLKKHGKRILRLYLTMVFWKMIYLLVFLPGYHYGEASREVLSYLLLFQPLDGVATGHFWFFQGMITVLLIAPMFYYCYRGARQQSEDGIDARAIMRYTVVVLVIFNQLLISGNFLLGVAAQLLGKGAWDITAFAEMNPFSFRYSNFLIYYLLGAVLLQYRDQCKTAVAVLLTLGGVAGLAGIRFWQTGTWAWQGMQLQGIYYWSSTMALSIGLFLLAYRLPVKNSRILQWIARYVGTATLPIYCVHTLLIRYLTPMLFAKWMAWNGTLLNGAESLLIVGCILALYWSWRLVQMRLTGILHRGAGQ